MTPEQIAALWAEYLEAATPSGATENGAIDLYDIEGMNDAAYALHQCCVAQSATPPAAVVEALERALRHADQVSRDLGWHRIYDETGAALAALTAWRDAQ